MWETQYLQNRSWSRIQTCFVSRHLPGQKEDLSLSSVNIYLDEISTGTWIYQRKRCLMPQKFLKSHLKESSISLKHWAHSEISSHWKLAKKVLCCFMQQQNSRLGIYIPFKYIFRFYSYTFYQKCQMNAHDCFLLRFAHTFSSYISP